MESFDENKSDDVYRRAALNLTAAQTNAVEVCRDILSMPDMNTLLKEFTKEHNIDHRCHCFALQSRCSVALSWNSHVASVETAN